MPTSYCGQDSAGSCTQWMYFTGWAHKEKPGIDDTIDLDTLTAKNDLTLYAVRDTTETYTVTYNANGHGKTRVDYVHVGKNETLTQPQDPIAHDGYVFEKWFTTSSCENGTEFDFNTEITKSITLYAKWTPESYKITYKSVGDDGSVKDFGGEGGPVNSPDNPIKYNIESETINLMAPTPAEGKVFDGWFNDATFSKKVTRIAKGSFGDRTFYAKWSTKTYRIAYLADNDSYGAVSDQFKVHGESINLETDGHFRRPGYDKQLGWTNTQNGSVDYEFGAVYTVDAPLILYPAWSEPIVYEIKYVCADCENDPSNPVSYTVNTAKELKSPSKIPEGYKFGGWFTDKKYSKKISKIEKGTTGNLTLYGKLNQIYNITYVGTDTPNNPKTYTVDNNTIQLKAPASREHYTFIGWFDKDSEDGQQVTEIAKGSSGDKTLYARWAAVEYKITYTTNDGTLPDGVENLQIYTIESEDITLPIPTKDGYDFVGWYGNGEFNGDAITGIAKGTTGDTTLFAKWNGPIEYTIIYNNVEGATNENPTTYTVESDTIQLVAAVKAGYDFAGWFDKDGEEVTAIAKGSTGDTTLYAKWTAEVYSITYNANEGTLPDDAANPQTYTVEHAVTLPVPTKNGYDFVGWYDTENNKIEKIVKGSTGDIELTAKWSEPIEYTINYNNVENATNGNPTTYTVESDTIQLVAAVKAGYDFAGWFDKDGEEVTAIAKGSTGYIELTAKWEDPIAYTITYELNGGTIAENANPTTYTVETAATSLVAPTKDDYDFEGWFTADNVKYEEIGGGIVGNLKLIAHWTATSYSITYVLNEGELPEGVEIPQTYTIESEDITLPTPTKSGYTFAGWYDQYGYSVGNKIINQSSGDITLYARWAAVEYKITYTTNDGTLPDGVENPQIYTIESEDITLPTPTKDGYNFVGWYDKEGDDGKLVEKIAKGSTGDTILYAKWSEPIKYTISYNNVENATNNNPTTYTVESDTIQLVATVKAGYDFVGWFDKDGEEVTAIAKGSTGNIELTAKWSDPVKYEITYVLNGGELPEGVSNPAEYTVESDVTLPEPTKKGYEFKGWFDSEENQVTTIKKGSTGNLNLTAKWSAIHYTITYVTANGANSYPNVNSYTVEDVAGDKVIELKPATRCGFKFEGWFKDDKFSGDAVEQIQNGDASNMVLYPKWSENTNLVNDFGAVKIYEDEDGLRCAALAGYSEDDVKINEEVEVSYVTFDREFVVNETDGEKKLATIVLPFTIAKNKVVGARFFGMIDVKPEESAVYITPVNDDLIYANTPYIVRATKANLSFNLDEKEMLKLNTSEIKNLRCGEWELRGVYSYKKWKAGDTELGKAYGYTVRSSKEHAAGSFARNAAGAYIYPFRAYLYNFDTKPQLAAPSPFLAKSTMTRTSVDALLETSSLEVFIVDGSVSKTGENVEKGGTTSIITVKTAPARMKVRDGWYDMKGRKLKGKPTAKGIYYYNGKKIRIQ
ncbi:MAG: InlB B-repeat-containing protein [Fibrobacter sp.]|nr:InlB B-repeat-containing protein [Fibrobacter sp.]